MAEEKKLGPNVTYQGQAEGDQKSITMGDVYFKPGHSVNLEERMGRDQAQALLRKLAGNQFFRVDGGPDWEAIRKEKAEAQAKADEDRAKEAEDKAKQEATPAQSTATQNNPPADWEGPQESHLERGGKSKNK